MTLYIRPAGHRYDVIVNDYATPIFLIVHKMTTTDRERTVERAMRRLTPAFHKHMNAKDVRHELYARDQLTWVENERIGACVGEGWGGGAVLGSSVVPSVE